MPIDKICAECGQPFRVKPKNMLQKFCSKTCVTAYEAVHGRVAARIAPLEFTCKNCGSPFTMSRSNVAAYRQKFDKDPLYCSMPCSDQGRRKDADERNKTACKNCGKEFYRSRRNKSGTIYRTQELCSKQCKNEWVSKVYRQKHGSPQITKRVKRGYIILRIPARDSAPMHEILEHRYVMEQHLGRKLLPEETVHHINGDTQFNELTNLELFNSNHGPGQRAVDKVDFAIEMLRLYPDLLRDRGYTLHYAPTDP